MVHGHRMLKPVWRPSARVVLDLDALDARAGRPVPHVALEPLERLRVAFGGDLDAAVRQIPDPAVQPLAGGGRLGEEAEADALHAPADQISPRAEHTGRRVETAGYDTIPAFPVYRQVLWLKNPRSLRSSVSFSANRSRRRSRTTSGCRASPVSPCCRPTRCRRWRTRPTSSSPRSSSPARPALGYAIPISIVIASLLAIVAFSYRQTIHAYPTGGGAYIVAKENIGADGRPDRGGVAAGRLHADRRGQHFGRRARDHVGGAPPRRVPRRDVPRSSWRC